MAWFLLFVAGLFEIIWAVALKHAAGFTRPVPSLIALLAIALSIGGLALSMRSLPLGTAYAVWTGIGTLGTVAFGILVLGESAGALRLASIALIMVGIAGLKAAP